jgi:hypothetical protein
MDLTFNPGRVTPRNQKELRMPLDKVDPGAHRRMSNDAIITERLVIVSHIFMSVGELLYGACKRTGV